MLYDANSLTQNLLAHHLLNKKIKLKFFTENIRSPLQLSKLYHELVYSASE